MGKSKTWPVAYRIFGAVILMAFATSGWAQVNTIDVYVDQEKVNRCMRDTTSLPEEDTTSTDQEGDSTSVSIDALKSLDKQDVRVYPNPSNGSFHVSIDYPGRSGKLKLKIYNVNGEPVHQTILHPDAAVIQRKITLDHPSGLYMLRITGEKSSIYKKLLIY